MTCPCPVCAHPDRRYILAAYGKANSAEALRLSGLPSHAFLQAMKVHRTHHRQTSKPKAPPAPVAVPSDPTPDPSPQVIIEDGKSINPLPLDLKNAGHCELLWWIAKQLIYLGKTASKNDTAKVAALREARETLTGIQEIEKASRPLEDDLGQEEAVQKALVEKLDALITPSESPRASIDETLN